MGLRPTTRLVLVPALCGLIGLGGILASSPAPAADAAGTVTSSTTPSAATPASAATTTSSPPTGSTPQLVKGGTVTIAVARLPTQFNPNTPSGANALTAMVTAQIWPSAFTTSPSGGLQPDTWLDSAELVSVSPQVVVYTINRQARWSDGVRITAADFIWAWHEELSIGGSLPANTPYDGYRDIAKITSSDHGRVATVTFSKPFAQWEALFSSLVPAHIARRYGEVAGFSGADPAHLVSGGPYEVTRVVPNKELVLGRNPRWWGPPPALDHLVFKVVRGPGAVLGGLESGSLDVAALAPSRAVDEAVWASPDLKERVTLSPTLWQLAFNLNDPVVSSLTLREAIAKAINRAELEADSVGFTAPNTPLSGNRLYLVGAPNSDGNAGAFSGVDDSEAAELLVAAGYHLNANGLAVDAAGRPLVLHLVGPTGSPLVDALEQELAAQLLDVGVTLEVHNVARPTLLETLLPRGAYQLALAPYVLSPYPVNNARYYGHPVAPVASVPFEASPSALAPALATTTTTSPGGSGSSSSSSSSTTSSSTTTTTTTPPPATVTFAPLQPGSGSEPDPMALGSVSADVLGYDDPLVDKLLAEAEGQLNPLSMNSLYNEVDTKLWLDLPTIPLFQQPIEYVATKALINFQPNVGLAGVLTSAQNWALKVLPPLTTTTTGP
ncbi:MAG: ABC transporter substrate-binding protein [Actinomycetota bacterium]|nr:ABC transporter substrate-binding protein [Actinomycetota bacterium]